MKKIHLTRMSLSRIGRLMYCGLTLYRESVSNYTDYMSVATCKTCLKAAKP